MPNATCILEGCEKPSRQKSPALCPMHYHRQYRHGNPHRVAHDSGITVSLGRRYRRIYVPAGHPMRDKSGRAYEHRVVLYEQLGTGPHECFWCGVAVDWLPKGDPQCLQVDHLNDDGADNRPANLVPSCGRCNATRALQARSAALRDAGWWSEHDTVGRLKGGRHSPIVV